MRLGSNNTLPLIFVIIIVIAVLLFHFVYFPKVKEVKALDAEYRNIKIDLDELYYFIGGRDDLENNIIKMREEMALLEKAFPHEREISGVIKDINEKAKFFKVNVRSLTPRNLELYKNQEGRAYSISECTCKGMPLSLKVEARYQALGEFLERLEMNKTPMITIEGVSIYKDEQIKPLIKADVDLVSYLRGK